MTKDSRALLVDITRCIGCRQCVQACMDLHAFEGDAFEVEKLSASALTVIEEHDEQYVRRLCMHCVSPSCASVCPVAALRKTDAGPVIYEASRCLGCRYCIQACPFNVPRYEWNNTVPAVAKCDMCVDRAARGELPACVEACPTEATIAGPRNELLAEAHRRIEESPDDYHSHVYGEEEIGGTSVLFLSPLPFSEMGLREDLGTTPLPMHTLHALERVPGIVSMGGAVLLAIWWITNRREEVARSLEEETS